MGNREVIDVLEKVLPLGSDENIREYFLAFHILQYFVRKETLFFKQKKEIVDYNLGIISVTNLNVIFTPVVYSNKTGNKFSDSDSISSLLGESNPVIPYEYISKCHIVPPSIKIVMRKMNHINPSGVLVLNISQEYRDKYSESLFTQIIKPLETSNGDFVGIRTRSIDPIGFEFYIEENNIHIDELLALIGSLKKEKSARNQDKGKSASINGNIVINVDSDGFLVNIPKCQNCGAAMIISEDMRFANCEYCRNILPTIKSITN